MPMNKGISRQLVDFFLRFMHKKRKLNPIEKIY